MKPGTNCRDEGRTALAEANDECEWGKGAQLRDEGVWAPLLSLPHNLAVVSPGVTRQRLASGTCQVSLSLPPGLLFPLRGSSGLSGMGYF